MNKDDKNKAVGIGDSKTSEPVKTKYFYPEKQVTIEASSQEEADEKYHALEK